VPCACVCYRYRGKVPHARYSVATEAALPCLSWARLSPVHLRVGTTPAQQYRFGVSRSIAVVLATTLSHKWAALADEAGFGRRAFPGVSCPCALFSGSHPFLIILSPSEVLPAISLHHSSGQYRCLLMDFLIKYQVSPHCSCFHVLGLKFDALSLYPLPFSTSKWVPSQFRRALTLKTCSHS
jgi:hypothetical protein